MSFSLFLFTFFSNIPGMPKVLGTRLSPSLLNHLLYSSTLSLSLSIDGHSSGVKCLMRNIVRCLFNYSLFTMEFVSFHFPLSQVPRVTKQIVPGPGIIVPIFIHLINQLCL